MLEQLAIAAHYGPAALLVYFVCLAIVGIMVFLVAAALIGFILGQITGLFTLYFTRVQESLDDYHPYTQGILQNTNPELLRLKELKAEPVTKSSRREMRELVQAIISNLERLESEPIKDSLISQVKRLA